MNHDDFDQLLDSILGKIPEKQPADKLADQIVNYATAPPPAKIFDYDGGCQRFFFLSGIAIS